MTLDKMLGKVGVIGRFKPLHNGGAVLLDELCDNADHVKIGIGSTNIYNERNPFTPEETKEMIDSYLNERHSNYEIIFVEQFGHIPEFSDGKRWTEEVLKLYGELDYFVSGNEYVGKLLNPHYRIIESYTLVPPEQRIKLAATEVSMEMACGEGWRDLVPQEIEDYLDSNHLVETFRKEFGLQTLALLVNDYHSPNGLKEEKTAIMKV